MASSVAEAQKTWTVGELVRWATDDFRTRGIASPRLDAELLVALGLATTRTQIIVERDRELSATELSVLRELVKRRRAREPMAYLIGTREFYGRPFKVDKRVLIPRPDTETLVEVALTRTTHASMYARALDLCTGSGCVAITIAKERPTTRVIATDVSDDAIHVARDNAARLGAYNIAFEVRDLYDGLDARDASRFEIITANPPYIATAEIASLDPDIREFEPRVAIDGGADGLSLVRRIARDAPRHLARGGILALEVGAGEADSTREILASCGFQEIAIAKDYAKIDRVVSGIWREGAGES